MLTRAPTQANAVDRLADGALSVGSGLYARFAVRIGVIGVFALHSADGAVGASSCPTPIGTCCPISRSPRKAPIRRRRPCTTMPMARSRQASRQPTIVALTDDGGGYRTRMANDAAAFHSMLPMYRVKFLYAEMLSGLSQVMPPVAAMRAVQVFSVLLFGAHRAAVAALGGRAGACAGYRRGADRRANLPTRRAATRPTCCARRCCSAGSMPMCRQRQAATAILLLLAVLVRPDNVIFVGVFAVLLLAFRQWSSGALAGDRRLLCRLFRDLALGRTSRLVAASLFLEHRAADEHGRLRSGLFGRALRQGVRQRGGALDHLQHLGRRRRAGACRLVCERPRRLQARPARRHPVCGAGAGGAGEVRGLPDPRRPHLFPQSRSRRSCCWPARSWRCGASMAATAKWRQRTAYPARI